LTLAATITKRGNPNDTQKRKQAAKPKPAPKRKSSNLSSSKSSKTQTGRTSSFQSQLRTKPTGSRKGSTIEKSRPQSPLRISSSDFEDDSFADLPSPSGLLARSTCGFAKSHSPKAGATELGETRTAHIDPETLSVEKGDQEVVLHDSTKTIPAAVNAATTAHTGRNIQRPTRRSIFEIWSDNVYDSEKDIFTNRGIIDSSATTAPFAPSTANTTRSLKRNARALEETHGNIQMQPSQQSSQGVARDLDAQAQELVPADIEADTPTTTEDAPTGWEDVDRLMLEEYGRFINFT
jgi:hypothetical protein